MCTLLPNWRNTPTNIWKNKLNMTGLDNALSELFAKSWTTNAWAELMTKPTLLIMQLTRATHEPDYAILTSTMNKMLPYIFTDHKHIYARYELFFCRSLTYLPNEAGQQFLHGEHLLNTDGLWNGIPSDQFIETTRMKPRKVPSGVIGAMMKKPSQK